MKKNQSGFTLAEIALSLLIMAFLSAMIQQSFQGTKSFIDKDRNLADLRQNLKFSLMLVANEVKKAGTGMPNGFEAILLEDGVSGAPDTLRVKYSYFPSPITLCYPMGNPGYSNQVYWAATYYNPGSTTNPLMQNGGVRRPFVEGSCIIVEDNYRVHSYLTDTSTLPDYSVPGFRRLYLYDTVNDRGQYFMISKTISPMTTAVRHLTSYSTTWSWNYPNITSVILDLEDLDFYLDTTSNSLKSDSLARIANLSSTHVKDSYDIATDITNFQVKLYRNGSTTPITSYDGSAFSWGDIASIDISITGKATINGQDHYETVTTKISIKNNPAS